jgi:hypothetical protein
VADVEKSEPLLQYGVMPGTHKLAAVLAALALTTAALAGCTATAPAVVQTPEDSASAAVTEPITVATPTAESTEPETCSGMSEVYGDGGGLYWERQGTLRDLGPREFAQGEVTVDANGTPLTYTVEPGDVEAVVAERLCAYPALGSMNHGRDIHPGQVLWLTPDPDIPWVPYYSLGTRLLGSSRFHTSRQSSLQARLSTP